MKQPLCRVIFNGLIHQCRPTSYNFVPEIHKTSLQSTYSYVGRVCVAALDSSSDSVHINTYKLVCSCVCDVIHRVVHKK